MDSSDGCFEIIHPMQSKEANGKVVPFKVIELALNIHFVKLDFGLELVVVLGDLDHFFRDIVANHLLHFNSILQ